MPLQKQPYALQFQGGLDTKTDTKTVGYSKLLDLQNAVFTKNTSLVKRNGYRALGGAVDGSVAGYANPAGLASRGGELVLFANAQALSYRPSSNTWTPPSPVSSIVASADTIARTGTHQTLPDVAMNGGVTLAAWEDSRGGIWASVEESASGREIVAPTQIDASGSRPRCLAVGGVLALLWVNGSNVWVSIVNPASPETIGVATTLIIDLDPGNSVYDACATFDAFDAANRPGLIAWSTPGGYRLGWIHPSGVLGSPITGLPATGTFLTGAVTGPIACALWITGPNVLTAPEAAVAWCNGSMNYAFINAKTMASVQNGVLSAGPVTWNRCTIEFADISGQQPVAWWAGEVNGSSADTNTIRSGSIDGATILTTNTTLRGHALASRAFYDHGNIYVAVVHPVLFFPYVAICQISGSMRGQARLLPGLSAGILSRSHLPSVIPLGLGATGATSRQHAVCLGYRIQLSGTSGTQFGEVGIQLFELDFNHSSAYQSAQLGRGAYLGGALIQHYDGDRWAEADFHCAPDTATGTIAPTIGGGGSLTTGQWYGYKFCYEEIDGQGELHPGATSIAMLVQLTGGNTKVTIPVPTYRLTSKRRVRIGVFRTVAAATAPTDPEAIQYFRVSSVDPTAGGNNGYILNDPTVDSISFVDVMSDAAISVLEPLYTNGGILRNDPVPSGGAVIAGGKSRLYWADPTDPHLVWFSQQLRDDTSAEFSAALSMRTDPYGGSVVGLCVMDDGVVAFKDTAIYVTDGPGPDPDGGKTSRNAFTPWALVTSDVGCKSPGSICQTPNGVAFQSQKGIKLLGRDRQVVDIGADVYAFNDQTIVRATLLPDRHQVVFLTDSGSTLLWDYERGQWSRFTNHEGLDAVVVGGSYYYLRNDGRVFVETPGQYADDNMHIPMVVETAWVKMAGYLQGWQKVLHAELIGAYKSSHQLQIRYRIDYQEAYNTLTPIDVDSTYAPQLYGAGLYGAGAYGGTPGPTTVYQESVHINQRCQAISFQFSDVEGALAFGPAFELSELLLTGGVLGVKYPVGAARSQ